MATKKPEPQQDAITPPAPTTAELAKPENIAAMSRVGTRISPYADVLTPEDQVLLQKGGIENLKIYSELLRDDQVRSTFQQRRTNVTAKRWLCKPPEGFEEDAAHVAAAEELQRQLSRLNWDDVTDKMMYAVFYGWQIAEVLWKPGPQYVEFDKIKVRKNSRFRFGWSGALYLQRILGDKAPLEELPPRKFWVLSTGAEHSDEPYGLGLAHSLYWPVLFKRNGIKFWLTFLERFGQPTAMAAAPKGQIEDVTAKRKLVEMLQQIATDAGVVVPDDVVVSLLEATRGGTADYESLKTAMNEAISKVVLSQTMTTDNGSSRAQGQVHENVKDDVVKADSDLVSESFRAGPATWWCEWNFPGVNPPIVYREIEPPEDLTQRAERDSKIYAAGYQPTQRYIDETYGAGNFEPKPEPKPAAPGAPGAPGGAAFAEGEQLALQVLKAARRGDQAALIDAAQQFANQYDTLNGRRVAQLLEAADFAEDFETFGRRLDEILQENPAGETLDKLTRATFFSRLLGALRIQRPAA